MTPINWSNKVPYEHLLGKERGVKIYTLMDYLGVEHKYEALRFAVDFAHREMIEKPFKSAEPEQKWIPVTEALPKDMDRVLVTIRRRNKEMRVRSGDYYKGYFMMDNGDTWNETDKEVLAWMPLPEPWRGE